MYGADREPKTVRANDHCAGVTFGGRDWSLGYYAKINPTKRAQQTAAIVTSSASR